MTSLEAIRELMIERRLPFFTIKYNGKELDCQEQNINPSEAADQLEKILSKMSYDRVTVELSGRSKKDKEEGGSTKKYTHVVACGGKQAITGPSIEKMGSSMGMDEYNRLRDQLEESRMMCQDYKHENGRLKDEINRLKEQLEKGDESDKTMMYIEKFAPIISGLFTSTPVGKARPVSHAIAGTPMNESEVSEKLSELMERWAKCDKKNLIPTIEAIVSIAESDPKKYKLYQSMLLS